MTERKENTLVVLALLGLFVVGTAAGGATHMLVRAWWPKERPVITFDAGADTGWFHEEDGGLSFALDGRRVSAEEFALLELAELARKAAPPTRALVADAGWLREREWKTGVGDLIASAHGENGEMACGVAIAEDGGVRLVGPRPGLCAEWVPEKWR